MNWGKGITIVIILFMGFIVSFVYRAFQRDADLVRDDYYEYELEFDDNKEFRNNYVKLTDKVMIEKVEEGVCLRFPKSYTTVKKGNIEFYRPDAKKYDRTFSLELDENNKQLLDYTNFREGLYEVTVSWSDDQQAYIFEEEISF